MFAMLGERLAETPSPAQQSQIQFKYADMPTFAGSGQYVSQMVSCGDSAAQANIIIKGVD